MKISNGPTTHLFSCPATLITCGEVVDTHIDEGVFNEKGLIDYAKATPFVYYAREYWNLGRRIGTYGFAKDTKECTG